MTAHVHVTICGPITHSHSDGDKPHSHSSRPPVFDVTRFVPVKGIGR